MFIQIEKNTGIPEFIAGKQFFVEAIRIELIALGLSGLLHQWVSHPGCTDDEEL